MRKYRLLIQIVLMTSLITGCRVQADQPSVPTPIPDIPEPTATITLDPTVTAEVDTATPTAWDYGSEGVLPPEQNELLNSVVADLSERLGIDFSQVQVIAIQPVTWSDSSLGCPEPEMAYAQVETPGFLIRLKALAETYDYHSDLQRHFILCQESGPA